MRYSVTGVHRELQPREVNLVKLVIASLLDLTELTTGAAYGVDTAACLAGLECHGHARHRLCIPDAPHNDKLPLDNLWVEIAPRGISHADSYMNRNERLIAHADKLIAFPETATEQIRSGTWATIRRARRAGLEVDLHPLDGRKPSARRRRRYRA